MFVRFLVLLFNIFFKIIYRLNLVRRPSYTTRYRTVRNRYPDEGSPQRRTIVRRAPPTIISEGNHINKKKVLLILNLFSSI